jgi:MFS family permease
MLATFMEVLDTSIANVALPHIAGNLSASIDESTWVLTSYLISNAIVLPLTGWLHTLFGRKRFYMICVVIFTLSSLLCGLAPSLFVLILCRVLQGVGCNRLLRPFWWRASSSGSKAWRWPCMAWALWWRPSSGRRWAAGSPTIFRGAGSF